MPRDKQPQASNQATKSRKKKDEGQRQTHPSQVSTSSLENCPPWMKDMITNLANELFEKKINELKEELKEDMEEEIKWSLIAHFGEIEEMTDDMKEEVKKNNNKISTQIEKFKRDIQSIRDQANSNVQPELTKLTDEIGKLEVTQKKQQRRIERLENENWQKSTEIRKLKAQLDGAEQDGKANDVQIVGLPENNTTEDDVMSIVKLGKQKFGMDIKANDVEHIPTDWANLEMTNLEISLLDFARDQPVKSSTRIEKL